MKAVSSLIQMAVLLGIGVLVTHQHQQSPATNATTVPTYSWLSQFTWNNKTWVADNLERDWVSNPGPRLAYVNYGGQSFDVYSVSGADPNYEIATSPPEPGLRYVVYRVKTTAIR